MDFKDYMISYVNSTRFQVIFYKKLFITQRWINMSQLYTKKTDKVPNKVPNIQFNEYFLEDRPILASEFEGSYWIVDGHHRYYRGLYYTFHSGQESLKI